MRLKKAGILASLSLPLALVACEAPAPAADLATQPAAEMAPDPAVVRAALDQVRSQWVAAFEAKDGAALAALYAEDAVEIGPDGQVLQGRAAIQAAQVPDQMGPTMTITTTNVVLGTDVATEVGDWTHTATVDGQQQQVSGKYSVTLKKQADGSWKIVQALSVIPAPPPAGA